MTFAQPFTSQVVCTATSETTLAGFAYSYTLTALTLAATTLGGDLVDYSCQGF